MALWDDITSGISGITSGLGDVLSSNTFNTLATLGSTAYDIYSGIQSQNQANKMYDILYGSAAQQDAWAKELSDRTKSAYWPLEDLNLQYAKEDLAALRPTDILKRDYNVQRTQEQINQAKSINPMLDTTERKLLGTLTEDKTDLANRLRDEASSNIAQSFGTARSSDARRMGLLGINPSSGASLDYNRNMSISEAAAQANARTQAARTAEDTALNRQAQALNYRAGIPLSTYNTTPSVSTGDVSSSIKGSGATALGAATAAQSNADSYTRSASAGLTDLYWQPYKSQLRSSLMS